jgi:hypothetical protein
MNYLIMTGSINAGFDFTGPFATYKEAWDYAIRHDFWNYEIIDCFVPKEGSADA